MSIYEYNKDFEEKKLRKAEFEYGQHELLKTQIQKKLAIIITTGPAIRLLFFALTLYYLFSK